VLGPFSGAAATGLAALQLGRAYAGIDINPAYHDPARQQLASGPDHPAHPAAAA
jgi:site-specific DNA-methyltransferase (cytosine-N4-specific)